MSRIFIVIILMYLVLVSFVSKENQYKLELLYSGDLPELYNEVDITGFVLYKNNEIILKRNGLVDISNIEIEKKYGMLSKGHLHYEKSYLEELKGELPIKLKYKGEDIKAFIKLPYIMDIYFNMYSDRIKPVLNTWINVEAKFSSGNVYPISSEFLDLKTDKGRIDHNELILPNKTDDIKSVTIEACLKNSNYCISKSMVVIQKGIEEEED